VSRHLAPWPFVLGAGAASAGLAAWGAFHPAAQLFGPTLRRTSSARSIALTFDDGPNPVATPRLLDLLDRYEAHATFFVIGRWTRACPDIVREIAARGHVLGNHTDTHPNLVWKARQRICDELRRCQESIEDAAGIRPTLFRPPFGFRGPQLTAAAKASGLHHVVMWTVIGHDWDGRPAARLGHQLARVSERDILVLHDGSHQALGADREETLKALGEWLPRWRDAGLRAVGIDDTQCAPALVTKGQSGS
jgi:peptidoglycan/xylan/chitin deacetylase (PgdA/CDA1 family)